MKNNMVMKRIIIAFALGVLLFGFESCLSCGSEAEEETNKEESSSSTQPKPNEVGIVKSKPEKPKEFQIVPVDLGLSVLWANANVGASSIYDIGGYYAWGEHETKSIYEMDNYFDYYVNAEVGGHINKGFHVFSTNDMSLLGTEYDTAQQILGGKWRMPTPEEFKELFEKCNITTERKDLSSDKFVGYYKIKGPNGKAIALPFGGEKTGHSYYKIGGYYWTTDLYKRETIPSKAIAANLGDFKISGFKKAKMALIEYYRSTGMNVRAVMDKSTSANSENSDAESYVRQFYAYYLEHWSEISNIHEYVANNYLTKEYAEEYEYYMKRRPPYLDIIIETTRRDGDKCPYFVHSCQYIGNDKVKVRLKYYDEGYGIDDRYVFLSKEGSNYRIKRIKAYDE